MNCSDEQLRAVFHGAGDDVPIRTLRRELATNLRWMNSRAAAKKQADWEAWALSPAGRAGAYALCMDQRRSQPASAMVADRFARY